MELPDFIAKAVQVLGSFCFGGMLLAPAIAQRVIPTNAPLSREALAIQEEIERRRAGITNPVAIRQAPAAVPTVGLIGLVVRESGPAATLALQLPSKRWPQHLEPKYYSLHEGESNGQLSVRSIDPPNRSVSVELNGGVTNLTLPADSAPALSSTVPNSQFQCALSSAPVEVWLDLYLDLTGRAILTHTDVSNNLITASLSKPVTRAEAAAWVRASTFRSGVAIIPGGDYFAVAVPASQTNLAERLVIAPDSPDAAREFNYAYERIDGDVLLEEYSALLGKKIEATYDVSVAFHRIRPSLRTHRGLTKKQAISVFDSLFRIHFLRTEPVDDTYVRLTWFKDQ